MRCRCHFSELFTLRAAAIALHDAITFDDAAFDCRAALRRDDDDAMLLLLSTRALMFTAPAMSGVLRLPLLRLMLTRLLL